MNVEGTDRLAGQDISLEGFCLLKGAGEAIHQEHIAAALQHGILQQSNRHLCTVGQALSCLSTCCSLGLALNVYEGVLQYWGWYCAQARLAAVQVSLGKLSSPCTLEVSAMHHPARDAGACT